MYIFEVLIDAFVTFANVLVQIGWTLRFGLFPFSFFRLFIFEFVILGLVLLFGRCCFNPVISLLNLELRDFQLVKSGGIDMEQSESKKGFFYIESQVQMYLF